MKNVISLILVFTAFQTVFADTPVAPYPKASVSFSGVFVLVSVPFYPNRSIAVAAKNSMYQLGSDGVLSEIWHADGQYSADTYISNDGIHFAQIENPVLGQKAGSADVGLRFYSKGDLIVSYSPLQLLTAKTELRKSISHYYWLEATKCNAYVLSNRLFLSTIDGVVHCFDMSSGKELRNPKD